MEKFVQPPSKLFRYDINQLLIRFCVFIPVLKIILRKGGHFLDHSHYRVTGLLTTILSRSSGIMSKRVYATHVFIPTEFYSGCDRPSKVRTFGLE